MTAMTVSSETLIAALWPAEQSGVRRWLRYALLAVAGSALVAVCAQIQVPFIPVPMTMQTFGILLVGTAYGWRLGGATLALYLVEGAAGIPVFAGFAAGPAVLFGSTGGYLFGFVLTAAVCGWLAERGWDRHVVWTAIAMFIGNVVMYVPGLVWLGILFGWDKPILEWGLMPFVLGDLTKLALAAAVLPLAWRIIGRREMGTND